MVLLLDVGNSRVKWAFAQGNDFQSGGALSHQDFLEDLQTKAFLDTSSFDKVRVASVLDEVFHQRLNALFLKCHELTPEYVKTQEVWLALKNGYRDPTQLGVDRWLAMVAGWQAVEGAFWVIDAGSALTVDLVDDSGQHLGGQIFPGVELMEASLVQGTRAVTSSMPMTSNPKTTDPLLGTDTQSCVQHAIQTAIPAYLSRLYLLFKKRFDREIPCFMTGGDSELLLEQLDFEVLDEPDLVLKGLHLSL